MNVELVRRYRNFIRELPKSTTTQNQSIDDLIALSADSSLPKKSPKTINDVYANVGTFLNWIVTKGYPIGANLPKVLSSPIKIKAKDTQKRVPFSDEDLVKLFHSDKYTADGKFRTSAVSDALKTYCSTDA